MQNLTLNQLIELEAERGHRCFNDISKNSKEYIAGSILLNFPTMAIDYLINSDDLGEIINKAALKLRGSDNESNLKGCEELLMPLAEKIIDEMLESEIETFPDKYYSSKDLNEKFNIIRIK